MKKLNQNFKKSKNPKFAHSTFNIHENGNKTSIQPILQSNSTSFMFNKIFCEMKGKKVIHWGGGGAWGNGGTVQIASWKCNFSIYLDIPAITTLLYLLLVIYVLVPSIYSFFYLTTTLLKVDIFRHSKDIQEHSFQNLQASDWLHYEEETSAHFSM